MRKYSKIVLIILLVCLILLAGCKKKPPTKTILDLNEADIHGGGGGFDQRAIVDSQGNILSHKDLIQPGGALRQLYIKDDNIISGHPTIGAFIRAQGARTAGGRVSDYYPINIKDLLSSDNIFKNEYWKANEGLNNLKQLERDNLRLSSTHSALGNRAKEFSIEDDRLCIQGGKMISNQLYYRSENSGCYGKKSSECRAHFAEFPLFKTCSSLTNLKNTFRVPSDWSNDYSISCNYNSNFASIPSFLRDVNVGYSHCLLKNNEDSKNSILVGYGVGNPQIENTNSLKLSVQDLFPNSEISSIDNLGSKSLNIKNPSQKAYDFGNDYIVSQSDTNKFMIRSFYVSQTYELVPNLYELLEISGD